MTHTITNLHGHKIWHFSDTHGFHKSLEVPEFTTIAICSGDSTNDWNPAINANEFKDFIDFYGEMEVKHKIFVPGNHDAFCFEYPKQAKNMCKERGITYLDKTSIMIDGLKFYGDPITPSFNNWYFMVERQKTNKHWAMIPEDTNILITHGPRKQVLDLSSTGGLHLCGDSSLGRKIDTLPNLYLHCFGHIHDSSDVKNTGIRVIDGVFYSNAAGVKDNDIEAGLIFNGNTFIL